MFKSKKLLAMSLAGVVLLVSGFSGCGQTSVTPVVGDTPAATSLPAVKVGIMAPLSGDVASYGESVKRSVELSLKKLGLSNVELVAEDSKCDPKEAVTVATKLITVNKVSAIIGELCSSATLAAAPVAENNQVVLISPASTAPALTAAGDYIFRTVPSDALQGAFGAKAVYQLGNRRLAVLYGNEDYGIGFYNVLKEEFPKLGGTIVAAEAVKGGTVDLRTVLTKIKAASPDALYIITNSVETIVASIKQVKEMGLNVAVFGSEGFKSQKVVDDSGNAAAGLRVTSVSAGSADFIAAHKQAYNMDPGPFAAQSYDAMTAVGQAIKDGAVTGADIKNKLYTGQFDGVTGRIAFDQNGDVAGNYTLEVVKDGKFVAE